MQRLRLSLRLRLCSVIRIFLFIYGLAPGYVLSQSTTDRSCSASGVADCDTRELLLASEESIRLLNKLETRISEMQQQIDALYATQKEMQKQQEQPQNKVVSHDCADVLAGGATKSGVYMVWLADTGRQVEVYCDMDTDGGGWLAMCFTVVILFCSSTGDAFHSDHSLLFIDRRCISQWSFSSVHRQAMRFTVVILFCSSTGDAFHSGHSLLFIDRRCVSQWSFSSVHRQVMRFTVVILFCSSTGDAFGYHRHREFFTKDDDNKHGCSNRHQGGWWYGYCVRANLNGRYLRGTYTSFRNGVYWEDWLAVQYSLKYADMKLRP
ncbi:hypothetical protein LSAT2_000175 [Lamellibrachia satsuma]|nr:hypothetical protein LSAT2_000175 [Lamellibrachia satsuma]